MGQQQLLLIVLGIIIVAIAVVLGIVLFQQQSAEHKRDLLINEGLAIANNARQYFYKPFMLGGGQRSFVGWEIPKQMVNSPNGIFTITTLDSSEVIITGTGNEVVSGTDMVQVKFIVTKNSVDAEIIK